MTTTLRAVRSLFLAALLVGQAAVSSAASPGVQLTVSQSTGNPLLLDVTLKNGTDRAIEFANARLPWGDRYSMVVVGLNPAVQWHPLRAVEEPSALILGTVLIEPGQSLAGQINLTEYVDGIAKHLSASDVTVLWRYDLPVGDQTTPETRLNGRLLLARTGAPR